MESRYCTRKRDVKTSLSGLTAVPVCILLAWNVLFAAPAQAGGQQDQRAAMLARAAEAELDTDYAAPPGDPLSHHISGFAKTLCSAVFVTGLEPDFAAESVGFFSGPYEHRRHVTNREVDNDQRRIHLTLPNGVVRTAKLNGDHGCVTLPVGEEDIFFEPIDIRSTLPDPATTPWPMGDVLPDTPLLAGIDADKVQQAVNAAFEPAEGLTAALVVTHKGRIIGERYGPGITMHTPLESWSMGKSLTATLMGVLIQQGVYELYQPAPVPEWQTPGDPRQEIRIADILRMSSGIRFRGVADPDLDPSLGYPDHLYVYTGSANSFEWAATRPQQWPPNTIGRYRNSDPVLTNYLVRLGVEGRGDEYLSFPQRELFDRIGIRGFVLETDPYGNYLLQGYGPADLRRLLLDQRHRHVPGPARGVLHVRCRRPDDPHRPVARPGRRAAGALPRRAFRRAGAPARPGAADGGGAGELIAVRASAGACSGVQVPRRDAPRCGRRGIREDTWRFRLRAR